MWGCKSSLCGNTNKTPFSNLKRSASSLLAPSPLKGLDLSLCSLSLQPSTSAPPSLISPQGRKGGAASQATTLLSLRLRSFTSSTAPPANCLVFLSSAPSPESKPVTGGLSSLPVCWDEVGLGTTAIT